jgi:hypothetical protein
MVGERSWGEVNAGVRKNLRVAQPLEIVAKKEAVHCFGFIKATNLQF